MSTEQPSEKELIDQAILDALTQLDAVPAYSEEAFKIMNHVERLEKQRSANACRRPSPDTILVVGANLVGICLILKQEWAAPVASKALGFVMKASR